VRNSNNSTLQQCECDINKYWIEQGGCLCTRLVSSTVKSKTHRAFIISAKRVSATEAYRGWRILFQHSVLLLSLITSTPGTANDLACSSVKEAHKFECQQHPFFCHVRKKRNTLLFSRPAQNYRLFVKNQYRRKSYKFR
jgi:hypothetical protein